MDSKLPPINHKDDAKLDAKSFSTELVFKNCKHTGIAYDRAKQELRCTCGVAFVGTRLEELHKKLTSRSV